jgi:hypothetical protein
MRDRMTRIARAVEATVQRRRGAKSLVAAAMSIREESRWECPRCKLEAWDTGGIAPLPPRVCDACGIRLRKVTTREERRISWHGDISAEVISAALTHDKTRWTEADKSRLVEPLKINIGNVYMGNEKEYSGGYYQNTDTQIGAQGPEAKAKNFTQQADQRRISIDLPALAVELDKLKQKLIQEATSAADYQAVVEVQAAKEAADAGDEPTIWQHLAKAGRWAFDVAVDIGTEIAAKALSSAIGIGA